jgi:hypothetical protein
VNDKKRRTRLKFGLMIEGRKPKKIGERGAK